MANVELKTASGGSVTLVPEDGTDNVQAVIPQNAGELYGKGNILGTVSQSGGVPTGAIIQRGSNANGEFIRYVDGTQICTRNSTISHPRDRLLRGVYVLSLQNRPYYTYPIPFINTPIISAAVNTGHWFGAGDTSSMGFSPDIAGVLSETSFTSIFNYVAIGRWY